MGKCHLLSNFPLRVQRLFWQYSKTGWPLFTNRLYLNTITLCLQIGKNVWPLLLNWPYKFHLGYIAYSLTPTGRLVSTQERKLDALESYNLVSMWQQSH
jgi:hypothetical protein